MRVKPFRLFPIQPVKNETLKDFLLFFSEALLSASPLFFPSASPEEDSLV